MKHLTLLLTLLLTVSFSACQKAKERPATLNKNIKGKVVAIHEVAHDENTETHIAFKQKLIAKITDREKRDYASFLLSQNKLTYIISEEKITLLEIETEKSEIIAEIAISTGILENETTDYNEKKSILKLTETELAHAEYLLLKAEIKTESTEAQNLQPMLPVTI